jgi:hypothetical protein
VKDATSWDGVIPARIKRVTAQHTPDCHERTFEGTMFINSLISIMGTGWIKTAGIGRQPG